jgi:hypothetical protein
MRCFKSLLLLLFITGCGLGGSSGNQNQNFTPEQKVRRALTSKTWHSSCQNDWNGHYITGSYKFTYSNLYNTASNTITKFPFTDTSCSGTASYDINTTIGSMTFGHVDGETNTNDEIETSMGLSYKLNSDISSVTIIPYDSNGITTAVACGISSPSLGTEYDVSGCIAEGLPSAGSTGYSLMYVNDANTTFTVEIKGANFIDPNSRPTDFSVRAADFMSYN